MKTKLVLGVLLISMMCLGLASTASAAGSKYEGTVTYVAVSSETTKQADGKTVLRDHSKGVVLSTDPTASIHLSTQDCYGTNLMGTDGKPMMANGYCDGIDKDGDIWWIWWHDGADGNRWGFIGGTGKYDGVKGGGTTTPIAQFPDGRVVIHWEGSWSK